MMRLAAELREEIARLKGLRGRPQIKSRGMEETAEANGGRPTSATARLRQGGAAGGGKDGDSASGSAGRLAVQGNEPYLVQKFVLGARVVRYRREHWLTVAGETAMAPLSGGIRYHFRPELSRFVLTQHHEGQVTVERLATMPHGIRISLSKRQVMHLLIAGQEALLGENREVSRAGLQTTRWISVDDTGTRHAGRNGFRT